MTFRCYLPYVPKHVWIETGNPQPPIVPFSDLLYLGGDGVLHSLAKDCRILCWHCCKLPSTGKAKITTGSSKRLHGLTITGRSSSYKKSWIS